MKNLIQFMLKYKNYFAVLMLTFAISSCSSYQNVANNDDGIYDVGTDKKENKVAKNQTDNTTKKKTSNKYETFFKSKAEKLKIENDAIFADIDSYSSENIEDEELDNDDVSDFSTDIPSWDESGEAVVNIYNYNHYRPYYSWYRPFYSGLFLGFNPWWFPEYDYCFAGYNYFSPFYSFYNPYFYDGYFGNFYSGFYHNYYPYYSNNYRYGRRNTARTFAVNSYRNRLRRSKNTTYSRINSTNRNSRYNTSIYRSNRGTTYSNNRTQRTNPNRNTRRASSPTVRKGSTHRSGSPSRTYKAPVRRSSGYSNRSSSSRSSLNRSSSRRR